MLQNTSVLHVVIRRDYGKFTDYNLGFSISSTVVTVTIPWHVFA